jgi:membrane protein YdbS with pleckstrin-like domain
MEKEQKNTKSSDQMSYMNKISDARKSKVISSFNAYPKDIEFTGQDHGEEIILVVRQHWAVFIPFFLKIVAALLIPSLLLTFSDELGISISSEDIFFVTGSIYLWIMVLITYSVVTFYRWFFTVNLVTTRRVVDIDFTNIFYHRFSEATLSNIQDVSHTPAGIWATLFDFGTVNIQTAAEVREFEFQNVPRPRDIQDTLNDLLRMRKGRKR